MRPPSPTARPSFIRRRPRRRALLLVPAMLVPLALLVGVGSALTDPKPYAVPSPAMAPTIEIGDRVLVRRRGWDGPRVGDVVALKPPLGATQWQGSDEECAGGRPERGRACRVIGEPGGPAASTFIERIVAGPGDRLELRDGVVYRNGRREPGRFAPCRHDACSFAPFTVPAGGWFVLGDARGDSNDSRYWGPVRAEWIEGPVVARYWPPSRIGGL